MKHVRRVKREARPSALAFAALFTLAGCGPGAPPPAPLPPPVPLHLTRACDLAPAAGVTWVIEAKPRAIAAVPDLIPPIAEVFPEARFQALARAHGGVDLRQVSSLCLARYPEATLTVAHVAFDPARVLRAFDDRSTKPLVRKRLEINPEVVRVTGERHLAPEQLTVFGREALAFEEGKPGPLRAAEAFARGKLKKALPALRGAALVRASETLRDAPLRAFVAGPFEGETAAGLGGLLKASTALGVAATPVAAGPGGRTGIAVRLVLTGAWGEDADAAASRLGAAVNVLASSYVGRLLGLNRPLAGPRTSAAPETLLLEVTLDAALLAHGMHDALEAQVTEIMKHPGDLKPAPEPSPPPGR